MQETINKRIFVGGLASEVTAGEITERFSRFGKVANLSMKTRKDESGNTIKSFAHLDLEGDEASIKKCFNTYQNTKWKGSVLQLQYAKESFLQKLEKEREEAQNQQEDIIEVVPGQTSQPQLFEVKGPAVPGTPVPGKKDWVVGKYGRVLPILKLKKSYKIKMMKYDPSKHCHAARVFKDDKTTMPANTSCNKLTWEITTLDTEITKKRKGEFPQTSSSVKKIKKAVLTPSEYFRNIQITRKIEEVEIVKVGSVNANAAAKLIKSNRFDSDLESDSEESFSKNVTSSLQRGKNNQLLGPTPGSKTVKENNVNAAPNFIKSNRFDSDLESDSEESFSQNVTSSLQRGKNNQLLGPTPGSKTVKENNVNAATNLIRSNRFDSDSESDSVESFSQKVSIRQQKGNNNQLHGPTSGSKTVKENNGNVRLKVNETRVNKNTVLGSAGKELPISASVGETDPVTPGQQVKVSAAETSTSPAGKHSIQKENSASTLNKIAKFQGLGMLGLLPDSSRACQEKLEPTTNDNLSVDSLHVTMASDVVDESTSSHSVADKCASLRSLDSNYESDEGNNYDSSSSANTDEIIARCKRRKGLESSAVTVSKTLSGKSNSLRKNELEVQTHLSKRSLADATLGVSGCPVQGQSASALLKVGDSMYDSDLDSNNFALVAKKLLEKSMSSKIDSVVNNKLRGWKNDNTSPAKQEFRSKNTHKNTEETIETVPIVGAVTGVPVRNTSWIKDSSDQNSQVATFGHVEEDEVEENDEEEKDDGEEEEEDDDDEEEEDNDSEEDTDEEDDDDVDKESNEVYEKTSKASIDVAKRLQEKSNSLKVTPNVDGKKMFASAAEKFKNCGVPIIDMSAFRFDPTKIQKTEMAAVGKKL